MSNPKEVNSDVFVDTTSTVIDSELSSGAKVYRMSRVQNSFMGENSHVGDFSRLDESTLHDFARIDRTNHTYGSILGRHSYTGPHCVLMKCEVGSFSSIAWGVTIGGAEHDYSRVTTHAFLYNPLDRFCSQPSYDRFTNPCSIGSDVWVGANSTILRGVSVGDGAVIAAGAVVTRDVPPYAIVAGVPAKVVKHRFSDDITEGLLLSKWWELSDSKIKEHFELFKGKPSLSFVDEIMAIKQKEAH